MALGHELPAILRECYFDLLPALKGAQAPSTRAVVM